MQIPVNEAGVMNRLNGNIGCSADSTGKFKRVIESRERCAVNVFHYDREGFLSRVGMDLGFDCEYFHDGSMINTCKGTSVVERILLGLARGRITEKLYGETSSEAVSCTPDVPEGSASNL